MAIRALQSLVLILPAFSGLTQVRAQQTYRPSHIPGTPPLLQRVDPAYADVSPLGDSLREVNMQADLRPPTGFQHVYRVPGRDDLLMRASGGMYAIFPQSAYSPTQQGMAAIVPAGTIFSIGMPSASNLPSRWITGPVRQSLDGTDAPVATPSPNAAQYVWSGSRPVNDRRGERLGGLASTGQWTSDGAPLVQEIVDDDAVRLMDSLGDGEIIGPRRTPPPEPATFLKTIVTDEQYRSRRLAELMEAAAKASRGG